MKFKPTKEDQKRIEILKNLIKQSQQTQQEMLETHNNLINATLDYFETRYGFNPLETDNNKTETPETK